MADLIASLILFMASAGALTWVIIKGRTLGRGLWRPSVRRDEAPSEYWTEVILGALFTLVTAGIAMHFATR